MQNRFVWFHVERRESQPGYVIVERSVLVARLGGLVSEQLGELGSVGGVLDDAHLDGLAELLEELDIRMVVVEVCHLALVLVVFRTVVVRLSSSYMKKKIRLFVEKGFNMWMSWDIPSLRSISNTFLTIFLLITFNILCCWRVSRDTFNGRSSLSTI